jgi:hypothetical protein
MRPLQKGEMFFDASGVYFVLNHQSMVVALAYMMPLAFTARTCQ